MTITSPEMVKMDEDIEASCEASVSNPEPVIGWKISFNNQSNKETLYEKESEALSEKQDDGTIIRKSTLILPPYNEPELFVSCVVTMDEFEFELESDIREIKIMSK